jgi:anti-sigma factor RsiW
MSSVLKQVSELESLLLMYIADELSVGDRAEIERRLEADGGARRTLEDLRRANSMVEQLLREDDRATALPVGPSVAVRNVSRAIRQWQVDRLAPRPEPVVEKKLRYPWWVYPTASAAALFLAFLVWWGNWGHDREQQQVAQNTHVEVLDPEAEALADVAVDSMQGNEEYVEQLKWMGSDADELASIVTGTDQFGDLYDSVSEDRVW